MTMDEQSLDKVKEILQDKIEQLDSDERMKSLDERNMVEQELIETKQALIEFDKLVNYVKYARGYE